MTEEPRITRLAHLGGEVVEHVPFTVFSVAAGLAIVGFFTALMTNLTDPAGLQKADENLFHVFHPLHLMFSAAATTAMFWRHERRLLKAVVVGLTGAVVFCGLSDVIIPYVGGLLLGANMEPHICIVEHPGLIWPFLAVGLAVGLVLPTTSHKGTWSAHSAHVLVSSMASMLYLVGFGLTDWFERAGSVLLLMVVAVMAPCVMSDIVFPILLLKKGSIESGELCCQGRSH